MPYSVLTFTKRADGADLAGFQEHALRRARESTPPAGCTQRAHSRVVERAYRHSEPAFDTLDETVFDEFEPARAWRARVRAAVPGEQVRVLLARIVPVTAAAAPPDGIKHIELVRKAGTMDRPSFLAHWRDVHGPLAASIPGVLRYLQYPAADDEYAQGTPAHDGVAILWFASLDTMREGARHPAFAQTREDMGRFMDMEGSVSLLTQQAWAA